METVLEGHFVIPGTDIYTYYIVSEGEIMRVF